MMWEVTGYTRIVSTDYGPQDGTTNEVSGAIPEPGASGKEVRKKQEVEKWQVKKSESNSKPMITI